MSYGLRTASATTGLPVASRRSTRVRWVLDAVTLYVATITASASRAAATAWSMAAAEGEVPVDRAVAVKPSSVRAAASTPVGGPVVPDGEAGSAPTTRSLRCVRRSRGRVASSLTSRVVVRSAMRSAVARWDFVPTVRSTAAGSAQGRSKSPRRAFRRRMRRIDSSRRASVSSPSRTALSTAFQATSSDGGLSNWSTPALSASTGTRSSPYLVRTPCMPSESVITTPS